MKKLKSSFTNMVVTLSAFAITIGALLAWVNHITKEPISAQEEKALADGIRSVMGGEEIKIADIDTVKKSVEGKEQRLVLYAVSTPKNENLGTAVMSSVMAFGGDMRILVGFDNERNILGYTILQSLETPGLGAKADKWFQKDGKSSIVGMTPSKDNLRVKQDGGDIDAITASTITSRAFLKAVRQAYDAVSLETVDGETAASKQTDTNTTASEHHHEKGENTVHKQH